MPCSAAAATGAIAPINSQSKNFPGVNSYQIRILLVAEQIFTSNAV